MSKVIDLSGEGHPTPVSVPHTNATSELLEAAKKANIVPPDVTAEDAHFYCDEDELPASGPSLPASQKPRLRIHCHRCKKVQVTVSYNLTQKTHEFSPNVRVRRVLKWALSAFGLTGADAENKELRYGSSGGQPMDEDAAVGSYAAFPKCEVSAYLTDIVQVQG